MVELADRLEVMMVRVTSGDGNLMARFEGGHELSVKMRPGSFRSYREDSLARQLGQLFTLVWTGYRRGYFQAMGAAEESETPDWDARDRRCRQAAAETVAVATSPLRLLRAKAVGLLDWSVDIKPGALASLDEARLLYEARNVFDAVLSDHNAKVRELIKRTYRDHAAGHGY